MSNECSKERFLRDVQGHKLEVKKDDGLYRNIVLKIPESSEYWFRIVTWPGSLCITGDMGTYVYERIQDMFKFFRREDLSINNHYWHEKMVAVDRHSGALEFSREGFRKRVKDHYEQHVGWKGISGEVAAELWSKIEDEVISAADEGEHEAYDAIWSFDDDTIFQDFFDGGGTERYTYRFIWCLYAIVWGIQQYDKSKVAA